MATLLLRLGGPLQSWGSSSYYDHRETDDMPTKSGIIGMLAAALGRSRSDPLEDLNELAFGVRIDMPGKRLEDYQVTNMGPKLKPNISTRIYLSDALFLVGLSSSDTAFLTELSYAIDHPRFPLFLGRRSCPPTLPLNLGIRDLPLYEALCNEDWLTPEWRRAELTRFNREIYLRIVMDAENGTAIKKDVPISFSPFHREYRYRYITEMPAKKITGECSAKSMEHDPMKGLE